MDVIFVLAVALGGAAGSMLRWAIASSVQAYTPWPKWTGTFLANMLACLLAGWLLHDDASSPFHLAAGVGALSTFSTFALETVEDWHAGRRRTACTSVCTSLVGGPVLILAGAMLA
ncbi:MAG: CrcB family protein [Phycisphaerales bacterium]|nr:CrcB family protein [Phycisphaerales bacterium]